MTPAQEMARAKMAANPFVPGEGQAEWRQAHAAEYSAYYLGEIAKHLEAIAAQMRNETSNSSKIALALTGIAHVLPNLERAR